MHPEIDSLVDQLDARPHPPVVFITPRMIPIRLRRNKSDIAYVALRSLKREASSRLISRLLKDKDVSISSDEADELITLGDGHPFNICRMIDDISEKGLKVFLSNPSEFIDWKHRQSSEYLTKISLSEGEQHVLGLLKLIPELDFDALLSALPLDSSKISEELVRLTQLHILESYSDRFVISPATRVAVERDKRIGLSKEIRKTAIAALASSLTIRLEEGAVAVSLLDSAILSNLEQSDEVPAIMSAFLLPSHYVWLAKRNYDQREYPESIRLARNALKGEKRLSAGAFVAAVRYMCLSACRVGDDEMFAEGIKIAERRANDDWAKSNVAFLRGFNFRFKGNLPFAEKEF